MTIKISDFTFPDGTINVHGLGGAYNEEAIAKAKEQTERHIMANQSKTIERNRSYARKISEDQARKLTTNFISDPKNWTGILRLLIGKPLPSVDKKSLQDCVVLAKMFCDTKIGLDKFIGAITAVIDECKAREELTEELVKQKFLSGDE